MSRMMHHILMAMRNILTIKFENLPKDTRITILLV